MLVNIITTLAISRTVLVIGITSVVVGDIIERTKRTTVALAAVALVIELQKDYSPFVIIT
jgi:hypothetical protein